MGTVIFGLACVASGLAMCLRPRRMADVYGLPRSVALAAVLGARDVVIGVGLLRAADTPRWWRARAASDLLDGVLIASRRRVGSGEPAVAWTIARVGVAGALAAYAWQRAGHLAPPRAPCLPGYARERHARAQRARR